MTIAARKFTPQVGVQKASPTALARPRNYGGQLVITLDTTILDRIMSSLAMNVDQVLRAMAFEVESEAKDCMTDGGAGKAHVPSKPGEPPAIDTGTLKGSINSRKVKKGMYHVQDGVDYGIYLEVGTSRMSKRPFMVPAVETTRKYIDKRWGRLFR
jgi:HK97 gp10 family phage protein